MESHFRRSSRSYGDPLQLNRAPPRCPCRSDAQGRNAMKNPALLPLLLLLSLPPALAATGPLLPRPQNIRVTEGRLLLKDTAIRFAVSPALEDRFAADQLAAILSGRLGRAVPVVEAGSGPKAILLNRTGAIDALPTPGEQKGPDSREAYSITVTVNGAEIRSRSSAGIYYAVQTIRQIVEGDGDAAFLPSVEISDWPALCYRGTMMDMSHGPLLTVEEIKRQLDFLARWKANQYYFYSEASIELDGYPLLNPEGRFTKDQVREVIAYARQRHIDVIPCLELYGHLHDLFRVEKYAHLAALPHGGEFNPRNPEVMKLLTDWAEQFVALFPSSFVHIGFDETWQIEMAAKKEGSGATPAKLFRQQLSNVAGLFTKHGRKVMAWGDIVVKYPEIVADLPPGLIGVAWEYDPKGDYQHWLDPLKARQVPTVIATAISNWRELSPDFEYTFGNIDNFLAAGRRAGVMGFMNTVWTDSSQTLIRAAWPAMAYGAIAPWQTDPVDRARFFGDYSTLMYAAPAAVEVGLALSDLSKAELEFQKAFGQDTMRAFWENPFEPRILNKLDDRRESLRQTRLSAEDAQEHFYRALKLKADPTTLTSLLLESRMLDYAGLKFLTALEGADRWKEMGPKVNRDAWWNTFDSEWTYQSHGRPIDLMDQITELRKVYRNAWLSEYTDYRLDSTLVRWDAEYEYWRRLVAQLQAFSATMKDGDPLPPLNSVLKGQQVRD